MSPPATLARSPFLPPRLRRMGDSLLNKQGWCWGQDIRYPDGNLLLTHGFVRERSPDPVRGSSAYTLTLVTECAVVLWGFGIFYGNPAWGGLFLGRSESFRPALTARAAPPTHIWNADALPLSEAQPNDWERIAPLLIATLHWIVGYEQWILTQVGHSYRAQCLTQWERRPSSAVDLLTGWQQLAEVCEALLPTLSNATTSLR